MAVTRDPLQSSTRPSAAELLQYYDLHAYAGVRYAIALALGAQSPLAELKKHLTAHIIPSEAARRTVTLRARSLVARVRGRPEWFDALEMEFRRQRSAETLQAQRVLNTALVALRSRLDRSLAMEQQVAEDAALPTARAINPGRQRRAQLT